MSIYDLIDDILSEIGVPYYHGMPEFAAGAEPREYLSYTVHTKPYFFASGERKARQSWAAVSVFTPTVREDLYNDIIGRMETAGFVFQDGNDVGEETNYPSRKHYVMDFIITRKE